MNANKAQQEVYERQKADVDMHAKWDAYRHPHMKIFDQLRADQMRLVIKYTDMLCGDRTIIWVEAIEDFLKAAKKNIEWLETMKAKGYFATAEKCGDKDYWIDMPAYHRDQADDCFAQVRLYESTKPLAKSLVELNAIQKEIDKWTRFAYSHQKKAGGNHWVTAAKIRQRLGEVK